MLGNHADQFFTTPMRTRIYSGNTANQTPMPSPRLAGDTATTTTTRRVSGAFPLAGDAFPLSGDAFPLGGIDWKSPAVLGIGALLLLCTPLGKPIRRAFGF